MLGPCVAVIHDECLKNRGVLFIIEKMNDHSMIVCVAIRYFRNLLTCQYPICEVASCFHVMIVCIRSVSRYPDSSLVGEFQECAYILLHRAGGLGKRFFGNEGAFSCGESSLRKSAIASKLAIKKASTR